MSPPARTQAINLAEDYLPNSSTARSITRDPERLTRWWCVDGRF